MIKLLQLWKFLVPQLHIDMGGGGGGGGTPAQTTQTQELPEWAKPYAKDILAKGQALTDINQNPYQTYGQQRIAGFTPLQEQAQQSAANMTPAWQGNLASQYAAQAGQYQPGRFGTQDVRTGSFLQPGMSSAYMSPYMQDVVDVQQREAMRQSDIQRNQNQAQAVGAGAFGGSRQALVEAERQRNLGTQLGTIQATGLQNAFQQGQQQFNQEQQARLQAALANQQTRMQAQQLGEQSRQYGAGLGLQAAGQLGQLGSQQLQQQQDIAKLQSGFGGQQQALKQQGLDQAYQDFLAQQNYPYKQLGFMSDLLRGTPTGSSSVTQMYGAQPSMAAQLGSIGMGAYGLSKFMAKGGVTSEENEARIVDNLSDQQLQQALKAAQARRDMQEVQVINEEMAERASLRGGLGGAFNSLPGEQQQDIIHAAGGGILAFAGGGKAPRTSEEYIAQAMGMDYTAPTRADREAAIEDELAYQKAKRGESVTAPYMKEIKAEREGLAKLGKENEGLAWLAAAKGLVSSPVLGTGIGNAFGAAGETLAKGRKEMTEANRALRESEMKLALADQAREEGMLDKATTLYQDAEKLKREGIEKTRSANLTAANTLAHKEASRFTAEMGYAGHKLTANRATDLERIAGANLRKILAADSTIKDDPQRFANAEAMAYKDAADSLGKYPGSARAEAAGSALYDKAADNVDKALEINGDYIKLRKKDPAAAHQQRANLIASEVQAMKQAGVGGGAAGAGGAAAPQSVTVGGNTYVRPPSMSDAQWASYQEYLKGVK